MANSRVRLSSAGMKALLNGGGVRSAVRREAEQVAQRARSIAPVQSGDYRDSIHVVDDTTDRAVARVVASDWKASVIEARSRVLGRALGES